MIPPCIVEEKGVSLRLAVAKAPLERVQRIGVGICISRLKRTSTQQYCDIACLYALVESLNLVAPVALATIDFSRLASDG